MENSKGGSEMVMFTLLKSTVMEMLECNAFILFFGCCSAVNTLCGEEIPKQLFAFEYSFFV